MIDWDSFSYRGNWPIRSQFDEDLLGSNQT